METIPKINTAKSLFFEKIMKWTPHKPGSSRKKRKKTQINKIRTDKGEVKI